MISVTKLLNSNEIINLIDKDMDIILPLSNGEPHGLLDILEENYRAIEQRQSPSIAGIART